MFNPFLSNLSDLTETELHSKSSDLTRKYWLTQNPQLRAQIGVLIDQLKQEQQERILRQKENSSDDDNGLDNLININ